MFEEDLCPNTVIHWGKKPGSGSYFGLCNFHLGGGGVQTGLGYSNQTEFPQSCSSLHTFWTEVRRDTGLLLIGQPHNEWHNWNANMSSTSVAASFRTFLAQTAWIRPSLQPQVLEQRKLKRKYINWNHACVI